MSQGNYPALKHRHFDRCEVDVRTTAGTMSSGFVSGGTTEEPKERDQQWLDAQKELEAERQRKAEEGKQEGGKSLYEVLQQNKGTVILLGLSVPSLVYS